MVCNGVHQQQILDSKVGGSEDNDLENGESITLLVDTATEHLPVKPMTVFRERTLSPSFIWLFFGPEQTVFFV